MILLTVDASSAAESALGTATELARRFDQPLRVLLVVEGALRHHFAQLARERGTDPEAEARGYVDSVVAGARELGLTDVDGEIETAADSGSAIVHRAARGDVALLVMATHGRSGLSRWLTGSVTEFVIRSSPVPVVVVPVQPAVAPSG